MFIRRASGVSTGSSPRTCSTTWAAAGMSSAEISCSWRVERPTEDFSSSEVPSATFRPWSITAIRSASWSASSRYWVVSRIVLPCCTSSRIVVHIWPRVRGSSPVVGSSRKISGGRVIRLAARSSRRRMPPENWAICLVAASSSPNWPSSRAAVSRASGRLRPWSRANRMRFSVAVRFSSTEAYCPVTPRSWRTTWGWRRTSVPKICASPASIGSSVASILSIVVLPAPLGPRTPNTSPRRTTRSTPSTARWSPKVLTSPWASTARSAAGEVEKWCVVMSGSLRPPGFTAVSRRTRGPASCTPPCTGLHTGLAGIVDPRRGATHIASPDLDDGCHAFVCGL